MGKQKIHKKSGTHEWAQKTVNIQFGCENNCKYCYAKRMAQRFNRVPLAGWDHPILKLEKPPIPSNTKVMFPSTHDIHPNNLTMALICMDLILSKGNELLIVTKPRLECIHAITTDEKKTHQLDSFIKKSNLPPKSQSIEEPSKTEIPKGSPEPKREFGQDMEAPSYLKWGLIFCELEQKNRIPCQKCECHPCECRDGVYQAHTYNSFVKSLLNLEKEKNSKKKGMP